MNQKGGTALCTLYPIHRVRLRQSVNTLIQGSAADVSAVVPRSMKLMLSLADHEVCHDRSQQPIARICQAE